MPALPRGCGLSTVWQAHATQSMTFTHTRPPVRVTYSYLITAFAVSADIAVGDVPVLFAQCAFEDLPAPEMGSASTKATLRAACSGRPGRGRTRATARR